MDWLNQRLANANQRDDVDTMAALADRYGLTFDADGGCYPIFRDGSDRSVIIRCSDCRWRGMDWEDDRSWATAEAALATLLDEAKVP